MRQADLANGLIEAADHLAALGTEAAYRRAISTAYYAAFHGLIDASCNLLFREGVHAEVAVRNFNHAAMRRAAFHFSQADLNDEQKKCGLDEPPSESLRAVCANFGDLVEARERADYSIRVTHKATQAQQHLGYSKNILEYCRKPDDPTGLTALAVCMLMKSTNWKVR